MQIVEERTRPNVNQNLGERNGETWSLLDGPAQN